jgi:hypothetical protein
VGLRIALDAVEKSKISQKNANCVARSTKTAHMMKAKESGSAAWKGTKAMSHTICLHGKRQRSLAVLQMDPCLLEGSFEDL